MSGGTGFSIMAAWPMPFGQEARREVVAEGLVTEAEVRTHLKDVIGKAPMVAVFRGNQGRPVEQYDGNGRRVR